MPSSRLQEDNYSAWERSQKAAREKAAADLAAQTEANRKADHPANYVWMDQIEARPEGKNRDEVKAQAGQWVDPNAGKGDLFSHFIGNIGNAGQDVVQLVKDHPEIALAVALGTGFGTGMIGGAGAGAGVGGGVAANPMAIDAATAAMTGGTAGGTLPAASAAWTLKDINSALATTRLAAQAAKDPIGALKNYGVNQLTGLVDKDISDLITNLGGDLKGTVKTAVDTATGTDSKTQQTGTDKTQQTGTDKTRQTGTEKDKTQQTEHTPYGIPPALLALIASQLGQQQQPVQTPLVELKSSKEFDPFGKFEVNAAQGGSTSDLIRLLRS